MLDRRSQGAVDPRRAARLDGEPRRHQQAACGVAPANPAPATWRPPRRGRSRAPPTRRLHCGRGLAAPGHGRRRPTLCGPVRRIAGRRRRRRRRPRPGRHGPSLISADVSSAPASSVVWPCCIVHRHAGLHQRVSVLEQPGVGEGLGVIGVQPRQHRIGVGPPVHRLGVRELVERSGQVTAQGGDEPEVGVRRAGDEVEALALGKLRGGLQLVLGVRQVTEQRQHGAEVAAVRASATTSPAAASSPALRRRWIGRGRQVALPVEDGAELSLDARPLVSGHVPLGVAKQSDRAVEVAEVGDGEGQARRDPRCELTVAAGARPPAAASASSARATSRRPGSRWPSPITQCSRASSQCVGWRAIVSSNARRPLDRAVRIDVDQPPQTLGLCHQGVAHAANGSGHRDNRHGRLPDRSQWADGIEPHTNRAAATSRACHRAVDQPSADGVLDGILRDHNIAAVTDRRATRCCCAPTRWSSTRRRATPATACRRRSPSSSPAPAPSSPTTNSPSSPCPWCAASGGR